ncbi:TonB-dependent siderophore receptor [Gallibacterium sp. AGMB14963]|uniref:TonB-dependent siderophore receptor n=1 Tax=Gallibacterium faecale TaxID=3019086 RepID=UPI0022F1AC4F|nr:TonB-dependent siderophore receptor [Gallibacterium sp. AGMB14963]MDA3978753.1 TonB-dependent siderophore receptor [Gallibacterium sp. AGMB14963]
MNGQRFKLSLLSATLCLVLQPVFAEESQELEGIDVIAGSMYRMGEVPIYQAKSAIAITRDQLDKQAITKTDEIGRYQAGFTNQVFGEDTNTNWFRVRGTEVTQAIDGLPLFSYGFFTPYTNTFAFEAIEVTKGADAMTFGAAQSGGLLNYVTKRPHKEQIGKGEFKLNMGNHTQYGFAADYTGMINSNESLRYRLVSSYGAKDGQWEGSKNSTFYISPTVEWDISDRTRLTLLTSYQFDKGIPSSNFLPQEGTLVVAPNGSYISRSTNLGDPINDREYNRQYNIGYELNHQFTENLSFNSSYRYSYVNNYHRGSYVYPSAYNADWSPLAPSAVGYVLARGVVFNDGTLRTHTLDNHLNWQYDNAWLKNTLVIGTDYRHQKIDARYTLFGQTSSTNVFNPTVGYHQDQNVSAAPNTHILARQLGFYLQNQSRLFEKAVLNLGVRHDRARQDEYVSTQTVKNNHTSYSASFMYELPFGLNPYLSYSESFNLPTGLSGNQKLYDPNITHQYEAGIKYLPNWLDGSITLAGFKAKDKGALVSNGVGATISNKDPVYRKGIEIQADINVTKNWNIAFAYTYLKSVTRTATEDVRNPLLPKHTFAAKTDYTFDQGMFSGLTLGAGVRYIGNSVTSQGSLYSGKEVPSATIVDLMARYQFTPNWSTQVNVENVGNRRYLAGCDYYCYYGAGRNINASISYQF